MDRAYYSNWIHKFQSQNEDEILGILTRSHGFALDALQRNAWISQILILKDNFKSFSNGFLFFEYAIPRMGKRVDVAIIIKDIVFVLEFKVGDQKYSGYAIDQVLDYSLDLKNFHEGSHDRCIVPIVVSTEAPSIMNLLEMYEDKVFKPIRANKINLKEVISEVSKVYGVDEIDPIQWGASIYKPTPTIIEAAQSLYRGHSVEEISRSDADSINLSRTSSAVYNIIQKTMEESAKAICFITGVPGAGKTLAGLNLANEQLKGENDKNAVFLSGNRPLVLVLQEALARDEKQTSSSYGKKMSKKMALSKTKVFIQNIHHFRDDNLVDEKPPINKVVIFDEAQRAWTLEKTASFMKTRKGIPNFNFSEPEFLIGVMDRHNDWSVIICLVGGGQEINTGEAGLPEWFDAIAKRYSHWNVYVSNKITDYEYTMGKQLFNCIKNDNVFFEPDLHLSVSIRSFRSEKVSEFVKVMLDCDMKKAIQIYEEVVNAYPIYMTRCLKKAIKWISTKARGSERYGIIASSGAYRLKPHGINVKAKIDPINWFLNDKHDVRSSYFCEDVATEFDIQGLELDWACVAWDADLRFSSTKWEYMSFRGTDWENVRALSAKMYLLNAYRVLLTRARQGMVIFIPEGSDHDNTRKKEYYDGTYHYLREIGIQLLDDLQTVRYTT